MGFLQEMSRRKVEKPHWAAAGVAIACLLVTGLAVAQSADPRPAQPAPGAAKSVLRDFVLLAPDSGAAGSSFGVETKRIDAKYKWAGAAAGTRVEVHWYWNDGRVLTQAQVFGGPSGASTWTLTAREGASLPIGKYRVEFLENGQRLAPALHFTVGLLGTELSQAKTEAAEVLSKTKPLVNPNGFPVPPVDGFLEKQRVQVELSLAIPGKESSVTVYEDPKRNQVFRFVTHDVTWAVGWAPRAAVAQGYVLTDPNCGGAFTEKWAPDTALSAPNCALKAVPWAKRGWQRDAVEHYSNPRHRLKIKVPPDWTVGFEESFAPRMLWVMGKLDDKGRQRLTVNVLHGPDRRWPNVEEFFKREFAGLEAEKLVVDGVTRPFTRIERASRTSNPAIYEIVHRPSQDSSTVRMFLLLRDGLGYAIVLGATFGATADELRELDGLRAHLGLP